MILEFSGLKIQYKEQKDWFVYSDMTLYKGQCICVMGESGCGKTTLLKGLFKHSFQGRMLYKKGEILNKDIKDWGGELYNDISYMPQFAQNGFNPSLTIGQHIDLIKRSEIEEKLNQYFYELHLHKEILNLYPFEISGGMKQRVALLMGFVKEPQLFVMDEPSSGLDYHTLWKMINFIQNRKDEGCSIMMVTHHRGLAECIGDKILFL